MADSNSLPNEIVQAIATANAESIGEQPAVLANLALAQEIFNRNMQQQIALSQQQALNLIQLAVVAKCVAIIDKLDVSADPAGTQQLVGGIKEILKCVSGLQEQAKQTS
ncbi:hypothetical protein [Methylogaea oryzae]|uniref:Uncharacterized protein n=1 Tax=Methylogaea oryzae TaxID=1295382 RepID=A0A8D4VTA7_9GAMM|nr:hypothetical protein [Methylogaea oryzae]BBL71920.1 hypothetical protein MoryE10_25260 [Methylogaea oryzae]